MLGERGVQVRAALVSAVGEVGVDGLAVAGKGLPIDERPGVRVLLDQVRGGVDRSPCLDERDARLSEFADPVPGLVDQAVGEVRGDLVHADEVALEPEDHGLDAVELIDQRVAGPLQEDARHPDGVGPVGGVGVAVEQPHGVVADEARPVLLLVLVVLDGPDQHRDELLGGAHLRLEVLLPVVRGVEQEGALDDGVVGVVVAQELAHESRSLLGLGTLGLAHDVVKGEHPGADRTWRCRVLQIGGDAARPGERLVAEVVLLEAVDDAPGEDDARLDDVLVDVRDAS